MSAPRLLRARLWAWAVVLRPLKHVVPFGTLVRLVHAHTRGPRCERFERELEAYLDARGRFPARAPANCLERSLAAYRLLCASGADPELRVGIRRHDTLGIEGHVWVTVDGRALAERPEFLSTFAVLVTYDGAARPHAVNGESAASVAGMRLA